MRRSSASEPVLITTAPENSDDEYDRRRKRYAIMMSIRAVCVLAAAVTYRVSIFLALGFAIGGMILPWCAVIIANDRPAKKRATSHSPHRGANTERALPSGDGDDRTVDG